MTSHRRHRPSGADFTHPADAHAQFETALQTAVTDEALVGRSDCLRERESYRTEDVEPDTSCAALIARLQTLTELQNALAELIHSTTVFARVGRQVTWEQLANATGRSTASLQRWIAEDGPTMARLLEEPAQAPQKLSQGPEAPEAP